MIAREDSNAVFPVLCSTQCDMLIMQTEVAVPLTTERAQ